MKIIILSLLFLSSIFLHAQKNKEVIHVFDKDWKPCTPRKAVYMASVTRPDDSTYQWNFYHFVGPLINIESYKDDQSTIPNGYFAWFDSLGRLDSSGYTLLGRKHGNWKYFTDKTALKFTEEYDNGRLIKRTEWDSARNKKEGNIPAAFRGGLPQWKYYITRHLNLPERAQKNGFSGNVIIGFTVDTTGKVQQPHIVKSVEYSMDQEALRVVREAPAWTPAVEDGRKTSAYLRQPIIFGRQN